MDRLLALIRSLVGQKELEVSRKCISVSVKALTAPSVLTSPTLAERAAGMLVLLCQTEIQFMLHAAQNRVRQGAVKALGTTLHTRTPTYTHAVACFLTGMQEALSALYGTCTATAQYRTVCPSVKIPSQLLRVASVVRNELRKAGEQGEPSVTAKLREAGVVSSEELRMWAKVEQRYEAVTAVSMD